MTPHKKYLPNTNRLGIFVKWWSTRKDVYLWNKCRWDREQGAKERPENGGEYARAIPWILKSTGLFWPPSTLVIEHTTVDMARYQHPINIGHNIRSLVSLVCINKWISKLIPCFGSTNFRGWSQFKNFSCCWKLWLLSQWQNEFLQMKKDPGETIRAIHLRVKAKHTSKQTVYVPMHRSTKARTHQHMWRSTTATNDPPCGTTTIIRRDIFGKGRIDALCIHLPQQQPHQSFIHFKQTRPVTSCVD